MSEVFSIFADTLKDLASTSGFANLQWQNCVMILVSFIFMYLAIAKKFEPLLLLPISFGMLLTNLPLTAMYTPELFADPTNIDYGKVLHDGGLLDLLYLGVKLQLFRLSYFLVSEQ